MSGLAALFHRDGRPIDPGELDRMLDVIPYRRRDGTWIKVFGHVGLGYGKLAVTPEDVTDTQPWVSPRTGCAIIADVRLDNRADLLARLEESRLDVSDAEITLRAYEVWGLAAFARLLGDFAIIVWDPRRQRLLCARDSSGQCPLYYRSNSHSFAAASEIHQLFQDPTIPIIPNEDRIRSFLVPFNVYRNEKDYPATFYDGIVSLAAGHFLIVERDRTHVNRYWELKVPTELHYRTHEEYAEHFRDLLFDIVEARLRTSGPVGATLSGGLDSSSIVCTAQELYRQNRADDQGFTSYSSVFEGLDCDETSLINDIEQKYGFRSRHIPTTASMSTLQLQPSGFMAAPGKGISELDGVLRAASADGIRVLLTGDIADACVSGSRLVFDSLLRQGQFIDFLQQARTYQRVTGESWKKILTLYSALPLLPLWIQKLGMTTYTRRFFEQHHQHLLPFWIPESLRVDLAQRHYVLAIEAERRRRFSNPSHHSDYTMLYPPEAGANITGWSMQIRRPFADRRMHEFVLAIPPEQKFRPHPRTDDTYAGSKRILRAAMRGILPESVRTRIAKTNFASLFTSEIDQNWSQYEAAFGPHGRAETVLRGYVDQAWFWQRLNELRAGDWKNDFIYIVRIMWLETWLRTFQLPRDRLTHVVDPLGSPHHARAAGSRS